MTERLRSHIVGLEVSDSWMTNTSVKVVNQLSGSNHLSLSSLFIAFFLSHPLDAYKSDFLGTTINRSHNMPAPAYIVAAGLTAAAATFVFVRVSLPPSAGLFFCLSVTQSHALLSSSMNLTSLRRSNVLLRTFSSDVELPREKGRIGKDSAQALFRKSHLILGPPPEPHLAVLPDVPELDLVLVPVLVLVLGLVPHLREMEITQGKE